MSKVGGDESSITATNHVNMMSNRYSAQGSIHNMATRLQDSENQSMSFGVGIHANHTQNSSKQRMINDKSTTNSKGFHVGSQGKV